MLTPTNRVAQRRLLTLFRAPTSAGTRSPLQACLPAFIQARHVVNAPNKDKPHVLAAKQHDDMGGPAGQETLIDSKPLRRRYAMITGLCVLAAGSAMLYAKSSRSSSDAKAGYVLVHDSSKGELDDVKYIKSSDLPRR
ncbi:hypothetical protein N657DRAFT_169170 [Parathielavia appendiculata]|uniref:Uncharacterized protein n=1 Tax=Parathielavia appendiculata TaxID=2587402 RepID=A0AAN6YZN0_9PEZI|nr:hypothetical protein N657DRAFT_169170 [Parathielavia appendiculata]